MGLEVSLPGYATLKFVWVYPTQVRVALSHAHSDNNSLG